MAVISSVELALVLLKVFGLEARKIRKLNLTMTVGESAILEVEEYLTEANVDAEAMAKLKRYKIVELDT